MVVGDGIRPQLRYLLYSGGAEPQGIHRLHLNLSESAAGNRSRRENLFSLPGRG